MNKTIKLDQNQNQNQNQIGIGAAIAAITKVFDDRIAATKPRPKKSKDDANCFGMTIYRDFIGEEEVIIEVVNVEPPEEAVGFRGTIEIEAYRPNGTSVTLTPAEHEVAIEDAVERMAKANKEWEEYGYDERE